MNHTTTLIPLARPDLIGLGVGRRTLGRYIKNPPPGFPTPIYRNGRIYLLAHELETYKATIVASGTGHPEWMKLAGHPMHSEEEVA